MPQLHGWLSAVLWMLEGVRSDEWQTWVAVVALWLLIALACLACSCALTGEEGGCILFVLSIVGGAATVFLAHSLLMPPMLLPPMPPQFPPSAPEAPPFLVPPSPPSVLDAAESWLKHLSDRVVGLVASVRDWLDHLWDHAQPSPPFLVPPSPPSARGQPPSPPPVLDGPGSWFRIGFEHLWGWLEHVWDLASHLTTNIDDSRGCIVLLITLCGLLCGLLGCFMRKCKAAPDHPWTHQRLPGSYADEDDYGSSSCYHSWVEPDEELPDDDEEPRAVVIVRSTLLDKMRRNIGGRRHGSHWGVLICPSSAQSLYGQLFEVTGGEGDDGLIEITEIYCNIPDHPSKHFHSDLSRYMGTTFWTDQQIRFWVAQWRQENKSYDVARRNCQNFASDLCKSIVGEENFHHPLPIKDVSKPKFVARRIQRAMKNNLAKIAQMGRA